MNLGAFSISLAVSDLEASRAFYEKLGFRARGGDAAQGWLVMKGPTAVIGLFQGMFPRNMLTFNPGWDADAQPLAEFTDVRRIEAEVIAAGLTPATRVAGDGPGPGWLMLEDPDGNPILIDQHV
ncbi:MAG: VOC family protein [Fuscovulum sp.]|nr:VOC family protein [Fuscovulum sp.]